MTATTRSSDKPATAERTNLFGLDRDALRAWLADSGHPAYRADQPMHWVYRRGVTDFDAMSNLSKAFREQLAAECEWRLPNLITEQQSSDGTRKWLFGVPGSNGSEQAIETVFIPEADRGTLCISSQVGCAMDCSFCSTAAQGFSRHLTAAEIIGQVFAAGRLLGGDFQNHRVISNVVFMGMGEPLANYAGLLPALRVLLDDHGFGLSKRRVTVSTSGLVPFIDRLGRDCDTALAISLHAPDDALRNELVPINRKYPIRELLDACRRYAGSRDRKVQIVFEYVMLDGVNDSPEQARALARQLGGLPAKVNLIPFNPFPNTPYRRSAPERIERFADVLKRQRIVTTVRKTRGDDIDAACGQLVGQVTSRQRRRLSETPVKWVPA